MIGDCVQRAMDARHIDILGKILIAEMSLMRAASHP